MFADFRKAATEAILLTARLQDYIKEYSLSYGSGLPEAGTHVLT